MEIDQELIQGLMRNEAYINELYEIKEEIPFSNEISKIYGLTLDKYLGVIISKQNIPDIFDEQLTERLSATVKLVEENIILVENIWIEESSYVTDNNGKTYNLYISEFSKEIYRNEFGLVNLTYYLQQSKRKEYVKSLSILKTILGKINEIHCIKCIAHLNLSTNNIYFNQVTNDAYLGPGKFMNYEENSLWYSSPEYCLVVKNYDSILNGISNDIWSIGCILAEMFFVVTPLFQSFSLREKIKKMIEILGMPSYEEVSYMTMKEYNLIKLAYSNIDPQEIGVNPLIYELLDDTSLTKDEADISWLKKGVFDLMMKCLSYNPKLRPSLTEIIRNLANFEETFVSKSKQHSFRRTTPGKRTPNLMDAYSSDIQANTNINTGYTRNTGYINIDNRVTPYDESHSFKNNTYQTCNSNFTANHIRNNNSSASASASIMKNAAVNTEPLYLKKMRNPEIACENQRVAVPDKIPMKRENDGYKELNTELDNLLDYLRELERNSK